MPKQHKKMKQIREKKKKTYEAVVIDGEDVLLLGYHVSKAATSRVLEGNAGSLRTQYPVNVITIVELVIKAIWNLDRLRRITVLNDDQMVRLKERPPHLQEIKVPNRGYHYIQLIFQLWRSSWHRRRLRCGRRLHGESMS